MQATSWELTERTALLGEVREAHLEDDAHTVGAGDGRDGALSITAIRVGRLGESRGGQGGRVDNSRWVVLDDRCVSKFLQGQNSQPRTAHTQIDLHRVRHTPVWAKTPAAATVSRERVFWKRILAVCVEKMRRCGVKNQS